MFYLYTISKNKWYDAFKFVYTFNLEDIVDDTNYDGIYIYVKQTNTSTSWVCHDPEIEINTIEIYPRILGTNQNPVDFKFVEYQKYVLKDVLKYLLKIKWKKDINIVPIKINKNVGLISFITDINKIYLKSIEEDNELQIHVNFSGLKFDCNQIISQQNKFKKYNIKCYDMFSNKLFK
jgi:hypothetical protein